jgi:hypothetical protein
VQLKPRTFFIFFLSLLVLGLWGGTWSASAAVQLTYFIATPADGRIDLQWETESEVGSAGFYIERSQRSDSGFAQISNFIPVNGEGLTGSVYNFSDTGLTNGDTYYYKLEAVDSDQTKTPYGPVSATVGASNVATSTATPTATLTRTASASPTATTPATPTRTFTQAATSTRPPGGVIPTATRTATFGNFATATRTATAQPSASPSITQPARTATATLTATVSATVTATAQPATATLISITPTGAATATPLATPQPQSDESSVVTLILAGAAVVFVLGAGGWAIFGAMGGGRLK